MIDNKNYSGQDFTRLRYSDALTLAKWRGQSHLDSHTNFISTSLYSVAFHYCIRNIGSLAPKYSELFASHHDDLRSEGYLCPYPSRAILDSRVLQKWSHSVKCTHTNHPYAILMLSYALVKRTTNQYNKQ